MDDHVLRLRIFNSIWSCLDDFVKHVSHKSAGGGNCGEFQITRQSDRDAEEISKYKYFDDHVPTKQIFPILFKCCKAGEHLNSITALDEYQDWLEGTSSGRYPYDI